MGKLFISNLIGSFGMPFQKYCLKINQKQQSFGHCANEFVENEQKKSKLKVRHNQQNHYFSLSSSQFHGTENLSQLKLFYFYEVLGKMSVKHIKLLQKIKKFAQSKQREERRTKNRQIFAYITLKRRIISIKYDLMFLQVLYKCRVEHKIYI